MTLGEALADVAAALDGTRRRERDGAVEWSIGGRAFAILNGPGVEIALDPILARAALGTPDTSASRRGAGWIAFRPATLDRFALDRAAAWFEIAYRRAGGR